MTTFSDGQRNTSLTITNSTASDAVFASAFGVAPGQDGYGQPLSAFPSNASPTVIKSKGSGNIILDKTYDDHGVQNPILIYDLIGMQPDNLFPLFDQSADPLGCATEPSPKCQGGYTSYYADITMTHDEADGMSQSCQFSQNLAAYPEVDLSKQFASILSEYASDPVKLEEAVAQFFKQTKNYQKCTLATYIAASTYVQQFAFAWANWQSSYTYFAFAVNQEQSPTTQGFASIGKIIFTMKSNAPNPADVSDRNGGYDIAYHPDSGAVRQLSLINGNLVTTSNPDFPDVSMLLSSALKSVFTGNANDNTVWPVLAGKIDGFTVVGVGQDSTIRSSWYEFFHPQTAQQWMGLIGSILGIGFAIYFIAEKGNQLRKWYRARKARDGRPPNQDEIEQRRREIDGEMSDVLIERERLLNRSGFSNRVPPDYRSFLKEAPRVRQNRLEVNTRQQVDEFRGAFQQQRDAIAEIAQIEVSEEVREAFGKLGEANSTLNKIRSFEDLGKVRDSLKTALTDVSETITDLTSEFSKELGEQAIGRIKQGQERVGEIRDSIEDRNRDSELEEEGRSPVEDYLLRETTI